MRLTPAPPPHDFRRSLAASYDAVADRREAMGEADWRWPIAETFLGLLTWTARPCLLEVGAGVGFTARWFADRGADVIATDLSPAQVAQCRAKGLEAHVRDLYDLGFPAATFDAVWAMNCVHHVPTVDLRSVLAGIRDVLVPGGLLYLGVWGGRDDEGIYEDDFYPPPRFFCLRSDATLHREVAAVLQIESFDTFVPEERNEDGLHMQSVVARRV